MLKSIEFAFQTPWLLLLLVPACLLPAWMGRRMRRGQTPSPADRLALVLRIIELVLVVVILAGFAIVTRNERSELVILADVSDSMAQHREEVLTAVETIGAGAAPGDTVKTLYYGGTVSPLWNDEMRTDATDTAQALLTAVESFNGSGSRRIVLLSDGMDTDGDAEVAARKLAAQGIRVDAVSYYHASIEPEIEVMAMKLPAELSDGQSAKAEITIAARKGTGAGLTLYDGDRVLLAKDVYLQEGMNAVTADFALNGIGIHALRVTCAALQDRVSDNNTAYGQVEVRSGTPVLIVDGTGKESTALVKLLSDAGYAITVVGCADVPTDAAVLSGYRLIVLMNVKADLLPQGVAELLETYVSGYGGSVLTTGGEKTYFYGKMKDTPFERFLPVNMTVEQVGSADPLALLLVIDVTDSMTRGLENGTPMDMARRGAIKCLDALNPNDYAGIITFSDTAELLLDMTLMENKAEVIAVANSIETVDESHMTRFHDALQLADDTMKAFTALKQKHVLFITDGSPLDKDSGFDKIAKDMKANGITLSTIAVGSIRNVVSILENLSAIGGGRCYFVESAYDLPDIMSTETVLLQVDYTIKKPTVVKTRQNVFPIDDPAAIPVLSGYIRTLAKPQASVALETLDGHPIYAQWNYGQGKAASFMSDMKFGKVEDWTRTWFENDSGKQLILNMVDGLAGSKDGKAVDAVLNNGGTHGEVILHSILPGSTAVTLRLTGPDGTETDAVMKLTDEGSFEAMIPLKATGCYTAVFQQEDADGHVLGEQKAVLSHHWSAEYECMDAPNGEAALRTLCAAAEGALVSNAEEALAIRTQPVRVTHDPTLPLAVAAYLCLLCDIILRRLQPRRKNGQRGQNEME